MSAATHGSGAGRAPHPFQPLIDGYAIRGRTGETLRCRQAMVLARAFGDLVAGSDGEFCIGHDIRQSSPSLAEAVSMGLRSGGHHVIHLGACTTPQLEWYVASEGLHGGLMITGGCTGPAYNGFCFYAKGARPVAAAEVTRAVREQSLDALFATPCNPVLRHDDCLQDYAAWLRQRLRPARPCKLCLDAGNGMIGAQIEGVSAHFQQLRLWRIGFKPDPLLSRRDPDPLSPRAQADVYNCVIANGGELGAVIDVDGDRLAVLDERGHAVPPHRLGGLFARILAAKRPGLRVLHDTATPPPIVAALERAGCEPVAVDGGPCAAWAGLHGGAPALYFDAQGHYGFSDFAGGANALLALFMLINHLTRSPAPLSALLDES